MPEEHNRVLTDHAADLLLAPTLVAFEHLQHEGLGHRAIVVGDVMTDVCLATRDKCKSQMPDMPQGWSSKEEYVVATIHRQENTDDPIRLRQIIDYLAGSKSIVRLLAHPRLKSKATEANINLLNENIQIFEPLAYPQLVHAVCNSVGVVTDSGGLQKEAFLLDKPCITVRTETEWVETVNSGWNTLDPNCSQSIDEILGRKYVVHSLRPYGDGHAADAAVRALSSWKSTRG
jgi:UDP-N-acetylglucosamine 2-epimerase (non-hydrolysing)